MRIRGVEFPPALIEALQSGDLVTFVGAGASVGPPSSLPTFKQLVEILVDQSNLTDVIGDVEGRPLDELLGQMADEPYNVDVHKRVAALVGKEGSENPTPSTRQSRDWLHRRLSELSQRTMTSISAMSSVSKCRSADAALPVGDDFWGLVYLHGRLSQEPRKLIVTDADFGKAYLTDAWAARFLDRMFAEHPVLFIGYSHSDVIMKYLARGFGRAKPRYILTSEPESPLWKQLGITPIGYEVTAGGSHAALVHAVDEFAELASRGLLDHREHVKSLVDQQSPSLIPEDMSYLESIISGEHTVKFFTDYARGEAWLRWVTDRPEFGSLFGQGAQNNAVSWQLATWFAENYVTEEFSFVALEVATQLGGQLGPQLAYAIGRHLVAESVPSSAKVRPWLLLVARDTRDRKPNHLDFALEKVSISADRESALFLFELLTEPELRLTPTIFGERFEIDLRGDDFWLRQAWANVFQPNLSELAVELLAIVDRQLRTADRRLALVDDNGSARSRPSTYRFAIARSPGDDFPTPSVSSSMLPVTAWKPY